MLGGLALSGTALGQSSEPSGSDSDEADHVHRRPDEQHHHGEPAHGRSRRPSTSSSRCSTTCCSTSARKTWRRCRASPPRSPPKENGGLSEDGLTWTIKIRDDVMWSDGEPLTAKDIAFTYNLVLDQNWSNFTNYLPFTDSIDGHGRHDPRVEDHQALDRAADPAVDLHPSRAHLGRHEQGRDQEVRELRPRHRRAGHVGPLPAWWSGTRTRTGRSSPTTTTGAAPRRSTA